MPSWKKVIVSGSDATLNSLTTPAGTINNLTASYAMTASYAPNLLISGSIRNVDYIDFNTGSATPAWKSGRVFWDNTDGALSVYNAEADVTLQVGQENWTRIYNTLGTTITNGTVVRLSGTHGDVPEVERAQSFAVSGSVNVLNQILGVATHDIEAGTFGYITTQGLVRGLNTNAFNDGDTLFVGTGSAGVLQNVAPRAPYEIIPVGVCVKASPGGSGIIYVAVQEPIDFSDLSSVLVQGTYHYGDLWSYIPSGSSGVWTHTNQLSGSYGVTGSWSATSFTGSLRGTATTASYVNTLNQNVLVTGSATIGATSAGPSENSLTLGARDTTSEGGQLGLNAPGGTYTSASFIDVYQNQVRILKGNNTTSTGLVAQWNLHTTQLQLPAYTSATSFTGTATANLAVDSGGNVITVSTSGGTVFPYTGNAVITGSLTVTGAIYAQANGAMYFQGGDDAALYDINVANHMGIYGVQDSTVGSIKLGSGGGIISGKSGRIGIGTTNPTNGTLEVNGNVYAASFTGSLLGTSATASYYNGTIPNSQLANSAITIAGTSTSLGGSITAATILSGTGVHSGSNSITVGSTAISLGGTSTTLAGLTNVTSTSFTGSLLGTASYATTVSGIANNITNNTNNYVLTATGTGAINGESNLTFDGTTLTIADGSRPTTIGGSSGTIFTQGEAGGWAFGHHAKGSSGTNRGGFGFYGSSDALTHYYVGQAWNDAAIYVISSSKNVGIGTDSPYSPLQVGSYSGTGGYSYGTAATFVSAFSSTFSTVFIGSTDTSSTQDKGGSIDFGGGSEASSTPYTFARIKGYKEVSGGGYSGYLSFSTTPPGSDANTERMRINSSGALLIGATSVAGGYSSSPKMFIVGGSTPLILSNGDNAGTYLQFNTGTANGVVNLQADARTGDYPPLTITTGGSERMRITAAGDVGIGTTNPQNYSGFVSLTIGDNSGSKLGLLKLRSNYNSGDGAEIYQDSAGLIRINVNSSTAGININSSGNVGIGTTSPAYKLSVVGKIGLNDGGNSVFVGENAGQSDDATANVNVGIGYNALQNNLTGNQNVAVGHKASATQTAAANNTAVGANALELNTTGASTTAIGSFALNNNIVGTSNTAVGTAALLFNTSGSRNIAFGSSAARLNTSGSRNIAIGTAALYENVTGSNNIMIGDNAGRYYSTGTSALTDSSASIFIGNNTKANANNSINEIIIGSDIVGLGNNTVVLGNDNITKTVLKGNVGIGTTSPSQLLTVNGAAGYLFTAQENSANNVRFQVYVDANEVSLVSGYNTTAKPITFYLSSSERMRIGTNGAMKFNAYGSGTFTGTAAYRLAVDSSGNIIETSLGSGAVDGSGTANYISKWSDSDTLTDSVIYETGSKIGIGTTNPSSILHLGPGSFASTNSGYNSFNAGSFGILFRDNYDSYLTFNTVYSPTGWVNKYNAKSAVLNFNDGALDISTGDGNTAGGASNLSTKLVMTNGGNVGIGSTSPSYKLDVNGTSLFQNEQTIYYTNAIQTMNGVSGASLIRMYGNSNGVEMQIDAHSSNSGAATIGTYSNSNVHIKTNNTNRVIVTNSGDVGIGTTSPTSKLTVNGNAHIIGSGTPGSGAGLEMLYSSNVSYIGSYDRDSSVYRNLYFYSAATIFENGGTESMRITSTGAVGIGTSSPTGKLKIYGGRLVLDDALANQTAIQFNQAGSEMAVLYRPNSSSTQMRMYVGITDVMTWTDSGKVGIGTSNPASPLQIGSVGSTGYAVNNGLTFGDGTRAAALDVDGTGATFYSSADIRFNPGTSETVRIKSGGNVGIGTTNPSNKLQVVGGVTATSFTGSLQGNISGNAATADFATQAGSVTNQGGQLLRYDNRVISPAEVTAGYLQFGFTAWNNDNAPDWADYLHMRSYTDNSGGADNLVMFKKNGIGMRIWQQSYGSSTAYSSYKDVAFTDGTGASGTWAIDISGNSATTSAVSGTTNYVPKFTSSTAIGNSAIYDSSGNIGIGTTNPGAKLEVVGTFRATTKSFIIDHPTKPEKKLQYGVLEGPEHSVYIRGRLQGTTRIELPDYWHALVHEDSITVNLTAVGKAQDLWVEEVTDTYITVASNDVVNCFYTVFAERKDVDRLVTEFDKE